MLFCISRNHLERKERISSAFAKMENHNLVQDCLRLDARFATREELELIHDSRYLDTMEARGKMNQSELRQLSSEFKENSIFMCPKTQSAALLAAGSALQVVDSILNGESRSGLAVSNRFLCIVYQKCFDIGSWLILTDYPPSGTPRSS